MRPTSPRDFRHHRFARAWVGSNDRCGTPIEVIENALADAAELVRRDLDTEEIDRICRSAVRTHVHDREQAEALLAHVGARR